MRASRAAVATGGVALALLLVACGGAGPTPASPASDAAPGESLPVPVTASPDPSAPAASAPASAAASAAATGEPGPTAGAGTVVRDDSLLSLLPPALGDAPLTVEEASFAEAAGDPAFASNVERAAFFVVASPGDLASGVVAVPAAGVFGDTWFADWRETYSEGACAQAGGVATNAETTLGGRTAWITTCGGGLIVYSTFVEERDAVVSLFSLGEGRYGERILADLRP